jgi:hypothetical protein
LKKSNDWCQIMYINKKLNYIWNLNLFLIDKNIHEYIRNNDYADRIKIIISSLK